MNVFIVFIPMNGMNSLMFIVFTPMNSMKIPYWSYFFM